ncbi:TPA: hypothetical protein SMS99_004323 [Pseudomonas aeruginosa]|uniref:hypothetical protein n=2 Tax=Pseudomonas aeruginosa TaxID=287 RepID=UPI001141490F|nr:hypothetical protein [Pseudomonas aeruginosa]HEK2501912.1 hypothetical protein [Pseudomonas aeruginosa]
MIAQQTLVGAIKGSGVSRVAIIDDAFDAPMIKDEKWGEVLDFFSQQDGRQACSKAGVSENLIDEAVQAISESDYDAESLRQCIFSLYRKYISDLSREFDPGGVFREVKGDNLINVIPVVKLLKACMPELDIVTLGALDKVPADTSVDVVFVDLFLDQDLAAGEDPDTEKGNIAVRTSLDKVAPFLSNSPSVILMSSHAHGMKAASYREQLEHGVFASRFKFIAKQRLKLEGEDVRLEDDVAEALLDIFQSYKFSRGLDNFLGCWSKSATAAVNNVRRQVAELDLRELSYLVQFRLADEGQSLSSYLEWFIGELLLDSLSESLDEIKGELDFKKTLSKEVAGLIDGVFDGPTDTIAKMYHRVRIDSRRREPKDNFRLGDLYIVSEEGRPSSVLSIMNPDCDLMMRPNGKRAITDALLVTGDLQGFDAPQTSSGDFIMVDGAPFNISWKYKKVKSLPFSGFLKEPGLSEGQHVYAGALKPLYAQEVQRNLLNSLGRIGVYVPPAIAISASAKVEVKVGGSARKTITVDGVEDTSCYLFPSRGGTSKAVVVFKRSFVSGLESALRAIDSDDPSIKAGVKALRAESLVKLVKGVPLGDSVCGILLSDNSKAKLPELPWCWITITIPVAGNE